MSSSEKQNAQNSRTACGRRAGLVGLLCNFLLFAAKIVIGLMTGALSIMADAVNNLSDSASSLITLLGFRLSAKPADREHPYGHARMEYLSGLAVSVLILLLGLQLAVRSIEKIVSYFSSQPPHTVSENAFAVITVLILCLLVKLFMYRYFSGLGKRLQSTALLATAADCRNDTLTTAAVLLSYVVELKIGWLIDGWMGALVAVFILLSGLSMLRGAVSPLLGEANDPALCHVIENEIRKHPEILGFHDLMIHDYGPGRRFASVHVEIDSKQDVLSAHSVIDRIENTVREKGIALVIHYDPVATDDIHLAQCRKLLEGILQQIDPCLRFHDLRLEGQQLRFDLVLPFRMDGQQDTIQEKINALLTNSEMPYQTEITFDLADSEGESTDGN